LEKKVYVYREIYVNFFWEGLVGDIYFEDVDYAAPGTFGHTFGHRTLVYWEDSLGFVLCWIIVLARRTKDGKRDREDSVDG
jgi:hypothetical protein